MSAPYNMLLDILSRHMSRINAETLLGHTLRDRQLTPQGLSVDDLPGLFPRLEQSLGLFLPASSLETVKASLADLKDGTATPAGAGNSAAKRIEIVRESDIAEARNAGRDMAMQYTERRIVIQKVATIISELARNIFMYAGRGHVELRGLDGRKRGLLIRAVDQGPGIPDLDRILEGHYRSKTGLGVGIRGTKRLADRFHIDSNTSGTRIEAEVSL
jgi:serine/threonine-protein kinase RsbT